jgi:hypothetical protein
MDAKNIINYKQLSLALTGNDNSIRKSKCPKQYRDAVSELETLINYFLTKNKSNG